MARYALEIAKALSDAPNVDLSIFTSYGQTSAFAGLVNQAHLYASKRDAQISTAISELSGRLSFPDKRLFDVIHGTKHLVPLHVRSQRDRPLTVLTAHDTLIFERASDYPWKKRLLLRGPYFKSLKNTDIIVADSQATSTNIIRIIPSAVERLTTVPLAAPSSLMAASPSQPSVPSDAPFAVVVGDSSRRKNLATIVNAWVQVVQQVPTAKLFIVGPPGWGTEHHGPNYERLVATNHVRHLGLVSDSELRWLYEHCRTVLCPSVYEGFGLPAAEAVAFDAPLIRSPDAALREAASGTGIEVPALDEKAWASAIQQSFLNPAGRRSLSSDRREWSDVASDTLRAISTALVKRDRVEL